MNLAIGNYFVRHAQSCLSALGQLCRQPAGSLLTIGVIGVALALPAGLSVLVRNGEAVAGQWESARDFSVYLQPGIAMDTAEALQQELESSADVASVVLITADEALAQLADSSEYGEVVGVFDDNPLPHRLVVRPRDDAVPAGLATLADGLEQRDEIDLVRLDTAWVARLNAILDLVRRTILLVASILTAGVLVIIGNTIRLDIQNRRAEIEVSKLLGASDAFVRRPFLYAGFWYGLGGSLAALLLLIVGLLLLSGPATRLSELYGGSFQPLGLAGSTALGVLGGGLVAGLGGAWLAVARHLAAIEPKI